ncbi:DUF4342 domain-containing protein [Clostridium cellulovorans]|uniref:DUF4342 domain-containing protein n=1 Tax=Clostridium cellulovorans (strain ATCC 35296 / DSM 3052 / OCM 3 / 743B) TaxID=573061 RepID=D9SW61_CLOC7|nr:DUF4342 domain-containing protein [Clostridium cellulovorans]ADL51205.1 hypothetical protein Clocel_1452 [Clostridium cellulovorans 743B]
MSEITLEKVDLVKDRTKCTYQEAKEALELHDGNVVDAIIYLEENKKSKGTFDNKDEFINYIKELINKGNITRIKIKKDDQVLLDVPVNAGVAAGLLALAIPWVIPVGIITAVAVKITVEITKEDGTVEVINKFIKNTAGNVSERFQDANDIMKDANEVIKDTLHNIKNMMDKDKFQGQGKDMFNDIKNMFSKDKDEEKRKSKFNQENVFTYTVDFEDVKKEDNNVEKTQDNE